MTLSDQIESAFTALRSCHQTAAAALEGRLLLNADHYHILLGEMEGYVRELEVLFKVQKSQAAEMRQNAPETAAAVITPPAPPDAI